MTQNSSTNATIWLSVDTVRWQILKYPLLCDWLIWVEVICNTDSSARQARVLTFNRLRFRVAYILSIFGILIDISMNQNVVVYGWATKTWNVFWAWQVWHIWLLKLRITRHWWLNYRQFRYDFTFSRTWNYQHILTIDRQYGILTSTDHDSLWRWLILCW